MINYFLQVFWFGFTSGTNDVIIWNVSDFLYAVIDIYNYFFREIKVDSLLSNQICSETDKKGVSGMFESSLLNCAENHTVKVNC